VDHSITQSLAQMTDLEKTASVPPKAHETQQHVQEVGEVDLSAYDYTEEESRRIVRKLDWHVGGVLVHGAYETDSRLDPTLHLV
jgi:transcription elongation GreA/GreB family factor